MSKLDPLFNAVGVEVTMPNNTKLTALVCKDKTQQRTSNKNINIRVTNNTSKLRFRVNTYLKDGDIIFFLDEKYRVKQTRKISIFKELYWDVEVQLQPTTKKGSIYD